MAYQLRQANESDMDAITHVANESRRGQPAHRTKTSEETRDEIYEAQGFDPNGLWLALDGEEPVGYGNAVVEKTVSTGDEGVGYVTVEIVPSHRGISIEQELMSRALAFIESAGGSRVRSSAYEKDEWLKILFECNGFILNRRIYTMVCTGCAPKDAHIPPDGIEFRDQLLSEANDRDLSAFVEVHNESFKDHFGYVLRTERQFESLRDCTEDVFRITYATKDGAVIGFSMIEDSVVFNREQGEKTGWILAVGVLPNHRRKGLGRALVGDCLKWFNDHGLETIRLAVDAENAKALALYASLGFETAWQYHAYEKQLMSAGVGMKA